MPPIPPIQSSSRPRLRYELRIQDLEHDGAVIFLSAFGLNPRQLLQRAVTFVQRTLYDQIPLDLQPKSVPRCAHRR